MDKNMKTPPVVSAREWETARQQLLLKEKALTHARDELAAERRRMPWLPVEKATPRSNNALPSPLVAAARHDAISRSAVLAESAMAIGLLSSATNLIQDCVISHYPRDGAQSTCCSDGAKVSKLGQ